MSNPEAMIAICIAAFNRRQNTLACLRSLAAANLPEGIGYQVYLLDDASTDGTREAVATDYPATIILPGSGSDFWAGGMRKAFGEALKLPYRWFIWMNDDVVCFPDAITHLIDTEQRLALHSGRRHVVSGGMIDPVTGETSYGGFNLVRRNNPSRLAKLEPSGTEPLNCDLVNANMLLIPGEVARSLGNIPSGYEHTLADWDFGLRARRMGYGVTLAAGHVGQCAGNVPNRRFWYGPGLSLRERYRRMLHPRALPVRTRARYLFSHFPAVALIYLIGPYLKMPLQHVLGRLSRPD